MYMDMLDDLIRCDEERFLLLIEGIDFHLLISCALM